MIARVMTLSAVAALAFGASAGAAPASNGPPPPPKSHNGHTVHLVASDLITPTSFAFGGGSVFEGDGGNEDGSAPGGVYVLSGGTGTEIAGSPQFVAGLAWHKKALYISGGNITANGPVFHLWKWSGWTGTTFTHQKSIYKAPKGFDGFNGLGFGANGRLYVGVDAGLTDGNDHGPASTSPYLYDILTFKANGTHKKVYAKGMRQPWQFAFSSGKNAPYVTDLGQDKGAKHPPDFILHVKSGQNYGFPKCNHTKAKRCKGYAKPLMRFAPHTDLMGIAKHHHHLYLTSFAGPHGKGGPGGGGEVYILGLRSGKMKPLITGFVAPTVGLGLDGTHLYVGELTGQVFKLKV
jgi:glucose/arabinose dehydrogenase